MSLLQSQKTSDKFRQLFDSEPLQKMGLGLLGVFEDQ